MREIWAETSRAESTYARICLPAERTREEEEEASHGGGTGFMCELASTDHPFFSFELPFHLHLLLLLLFAADRAVFRASNLSAPLISSNASSIFPSPVRNSYTSAREHACNLPRFQKRVRIPARVVSAPGWARTRKGNSFVIPVEYSYESCVNNTKRRERRDGRD